jgi:ribonuclease BN (tRNA processing enzyme)
MQMAFLGTGNAWSKAPENYNTNAIIQAAPGAPRWLIDCGTTAPQAMKDKGLSPNDFVGALVTHLHGDHVFGLEEVGFFNFFVHGRRTRLWLPHRLRTSLGGGGGEDIWENCLRGSMGALRGEGDTRLEVTLEDYFDVTYMRPEEPVDIAGVLAEVFEVDHVPNKPCYGVLLEGQVGFTADCVYRRSLIDWLLGRGCHTIFHDVYFGPAYPGRVHTAYEELLELPRDVRERIVLMHYNDSATPAQRQQALEDGFRLADHRAVYGF